MGFYLEVPKAHNKVELLIEEHGAVEVTPELAINIISDPDSTRAVVVVVHNGPFDAALYAYDLPEFERAWFYPDDPRPKTILAIDRTTARSLVPGLTT